MSAEFKFGTFAGDETVTFDVKSEEQLKPGEVLHAVYAALREKGYNPINQLVGYLISGDPTYITSYNNARYLIRMLERDELLEELVRFYVNAPEHQDQSGMER